MKSIEEKSKRVEMVDMHQFFIDKIDAAINEKRYVEASWLIYSCIENRFFRLLQKYKNQCKYCKGKSKCKKNKNELAISTKISCVKRLCEYRIPCFSESFSLDQLEDIRLWNKRRNEMMHDLLRLETYKNTDEDFKELAVEGKAILRKLYSSCTKFRKLFFTHGYEFIFPEEAMEGCSCKNKNEESA